MASGSGSSSQSVIAQKTWEMANQITPEEEVYKFDRNQHQSILSAKPWSKDPHFFKDIKISALSLLKMVMHARYFFCFCSVCIRAYPFDYYLTLVILLDNFC